MGNAAHDRRERFRQAAILRESQAFDLLVTGLKQREIAERIGISPSSLSRLLQRGFERRAREEEPTVEAAKIIYRDRLEKLLLAIWPYATGTALGQDDDTGTAETLPPDVRAGEYALKLATQLAALDKATTPEAVSTVTVNNVNVLDSAQLDTARAQIQHELTAVADRYRTIEGQLANTTLDQLTGATPADDKPAPPPARSQQ